MTIKGSVKQKDEAILNLCELNNIASEYMQKNRLKKVKREKKVEKIDKSTSIAGDFDTFL